MDNVNIHNEQIEFSLRQITEELKKLNNNLDSGFALIVRELSGIASEIAESNTEEVA